MDIDYSFYLLTVLKYSFVFFCKFLYNSHNVYETKITVKRTRSFTQTNDHETDQFYILLAINRCNGSDTHFQKK